MSEMGMCQSGSRARYCPGERQGRTGYCHQGDLGDLYEEEGASQRPRRAHSSRENRCWAVQKAESGTEERKCLLEPGAGAKTQSPESARGEMVCLPSVRQELSDSELPTDR